MKTKISIVGDIMCEPRMLSTSESYNGYDFSGVFEHIRTMFEDADYVIGNLECPLAGEKAGFTKSMFSFNSPDEFADALQDAGIDLVLTANNHCLDRGIVGLQRTELVLEKKGIKYAGTFSNLKDRNEATYFSVGGLTIAIISYTYGTNYYDNKIKLDENQRWMINLLRPQEELYYVLQHNKKPSLIKRTFNNALKTLPEDMRYCVKKMLGMTYNVAHTDDNLDKNTLEPYLNSLAEDIKCAKSKADLVIFCPHVGGQFNAEPGVFTQYIFDIAIEAGCDAIIASHPHVVQKFSVQKGIPCFYSIGNFSMSPNSAYLLHENKPEFGIVVHLYLNNRHIEKVTYSVVKMVEKRKQLLSVYPVDVLYKRENREGQKQLKEDVAFIRERLQGAGLSSMNIEREFSLDGMH